MTAPQLWSDRAAVPAAYRTSIVYSLTSLLSFVERRHDDDLVVVMLGDHQPSTIVSGSVATGTCPSPSSRGTHAVVRQLSGWGWQAGLRPGDSGAGLADGRLPRPLPHDVQQPGTGRDSPCVDPGPGAAR